MTCVGKLTDQWGAKGAREQRATQATHVHERTLLPPVSGNMPHRGTGPDSVADFVSPHRHIVFHALMLSLTLTLSHSRMLTSHATCTYTALIGNSQKYLQAEASGKEDG